MINHAMMFAGLLFVVGAVGVMVRRDLVFMLISVELMLNSAGLAIAVGGSKWGQPDGQVFLIMIFVAAATGVAVGISLLLATYHERKNVDADELSLMREREPIEH
jgi:NADH-quinone oxidoreductase subunit K